MRRAFFFGAIVFVGIVSGSMAPPSYAAILVVTRQDDPAPNGCEVDDCSLREAVIAANAAGDSDTIQLGTGSYTLTRAGSDAASLVGSIDITADVTIQGMGSAATLIDVNGLDAGIQVPNFNFPNPSGIDVVLKGFALRGANGPGIFSGAETLVLDGVDVRENHNDNDGGGMESNSGLVTIRNSTIRDNIADLTGGGLDVRSLVIEDSTVSGNTSGEGGGGIATQGLTMANTTVTNNTAGGTFGGGGIVIGAFLTLIEASTITNSTIADNQSTDEGGGVFAQEDADVTMVDTILWNNSAPQGPDCRGTIAGDNNIVESQSGCNLSGDVLAGDPMLFPLGDYGGPTFTRGIPDTSPAKDAAQTAACQATDQRGIPRPQHNASDACDIGAFEYMYVGDVDCSGTVELPDLLAELRAIARLGNPGCLYRGDLNCDRMLDGLDALFIARHESPVMEQARPQYCPLIGPDAAS